MNKFDKMAEDFEKSEKELARDFERQEIADGRGTFSQKAQMFIDNLAKDTMESLTPIASIADKVATPITEAVRAPFKYIAENVGENTSQTPPVDTIAPYRQWGPSNRVGLGPLLTDISNAMGIKQTPLIDDLGDMEVTMPTVSAAIKHLSNPAEGGAAVIEAMLANPKGISARMAGVPKAKVPNVTHTFSEVPSVNAQLAKVVSDPLSTSIDMVKGGAQAVHDIPSMMRNAGAVRAGNAVGTLAEELTHYPRKMADYFRGKLSNRGMSENYLMATAENKALLAEMMKNPGAIDDMIDMLVANPDMVNPLNRGAALDIIEGPIVKQDGMRVRDRKQGQLSKLADTQSAIIDEIPDTSSVWLDELAESAKNISSKDTLMDSQRSSANKLIDEIVGQNLADEAQLSRISQNEDILRRIEQNTADSTNELNRVLSEKRRLIDENFNKAHSMDDYIKNPNYREDLQWLSEIPVIKDAKDVFPTVDLEGNPIRRRGIPKTGRRALEFLESNKDITDVIYGKHENPEFLVNQEKINLLNQVEEMSNALEYEMKNLDIRKLGEFEGYEKYRQLLNEYQNLQRIKNEAGILTNDNRASYYERLHKLNERPAASEINRIRKQANQMIKSGQAIGVDPLDAAPRTNAGRAVEQAATDALYSLEGFEEGSPLRNSYEDVNRQITARKRFQELNPTARTDSGLSGSLIPHKRVDTGFLPGLLNIGDSTLYPMMNKAGNWLERQGIQYNNAAVRARAPMIATLEYKIPRDSQKAYEEFDQIYSLLNTVLPEAAQDFLKISKDPDAIKVFMRNIEAIRPDLFEKDRYGRIDGQIQDPALKQAALKDMMMNREMPPLERANKLEELLIEGRFTV